MPRADCSSNTIRDSISRVAPSLRGPRFAPALRHARRPCALTLYKYLWRSLPCFRSRGRRSALVTRLPPREARCRWVGAEGHPRQQRPFLARPAPADHEPCPSFLHRSPATHRPRHGTALSCHETSLKWSPLQPSVETLRYWDLQPVSDADERRSRVDEDVDQVRARSRPFGLGAREGGAGEPSPAEASGAVLAQCVSRARVRRSVRESPAAPFLRGRARHQTRCQGRDGSLRVRPTSLE